MSSAGKGEVIMTTAGGLLDAALVEAFRGTFRGTLLRPGDVEYDDARTVWNAMIDRKPALIARCAGTADVRSAVQFARTNNLLVSVRGGGHSVAGYAVCAGGLMIDLSGMKGLGVDPARRTARAEPGVTWGEFDRATAAFGLATTGGLISTTGIAGLTLGGGLGWLMRGYGLACDNLLAVDIVTATGDLVTASEQEHPDLFWGVRGGGGNFGIVTRFEYRLYPVAEVLAGVIIYPFAQARALFRFYHDYVENIADALTVHAVLLTVPDSGPAAALLVCYNGPIAAGERALAPLRAFGPPLHAAVTPMPYTALQRMHDAANAPGLRNYWKSSFLPDLDDAAIDALVDGFPSTPSPRSSVLVERLGGAVGRVPADATAFSRRDAQFDLLIGAVWDDATDDAANIGWARGLFEVMSPFTGGQAYVNYLGAEDQERTQAAYGGEKYERLVALKNKYDPTNFFRYNQNIKPTVP
jgi:FAD/FMN-containing dehydrogenase